MKFKRAWIVWENQKSDRGTQTIASSLCGVLYCSPTEMFRNRNFMPRKTARAFDVIENDRAKSSRQSGFRAKLQADN